MSHLSAVTIETAVAERAAACDHPQDEVFWYCATNEEGWKCVNCDTQLGFRPDLDRDMIDLKVHCILQDLHEHKFVYVSNGTLGEIIVANTAVICRDIRRYDQYTIIACILADPNLACHATFWQTRAERWELGAEPVRKEQDALPF